MTYQGNDFAIYTGKDVPRVIDRRETGSLRIGPFRVEGEPVNLLEAIYDSDLKLGDGDQTLDNLALGTAEYTAEGIPAATGLCIDWLGGDTYEISASNMFVHGTLLSGDNLPAEDYHRFLRRIARILIPGKPLIMDGRRYCENRLISTLTTVVLETKDGRSAVRLEIIKQMLDYDTGASDVLTHRVDRFDLPYPVNATAPDNVVQFNPIAQVL